MKKAKTFKIGDKVFGKVKGYPAWPALVVSKKGKKYDVRFYGTGETGCLKPEDLFYYLQYKEQYTKSLKRKDYNDAIAEIEAEIEDAGTDGNPDGNNSSKPQSPTTKKQGNKRKRTQDNGTGKTKITKLDVSGVSEDMDDVDESKNDETLDDSIDSKDEEAENKQENSENDKENEKEIESVNELVNENEQIVDDKEIANGNDKEIINEDDSNDKKIAKRHGKKIESTEKSLDENKVKLNEVENEVEEEKESEEEDNKENEESKIIEESKTEEQSKIQKESETEGESEIEGESKIEKQSNIEEESKIVKESKEKKDSSEKMETEDDEGMEEVNEKSDHKIDENENSNQEESSKVEETVPAVIEEEPEQAIEETVVEETIAESVPDIDYDDLALIPEVYLKTTVTYAQKVRENQELFKARKPDPVSLDDVTDERMKVLPVKLPSNKYAGIKFIEPDISTFPNEFSRAMASERIAREALKLFASLTSGEASVDSTPDCIAELKLDENAIHQSMNAMLVNYKSTKLDWLKRELELHECTMQIKRCLGLENADAKEALRHLETVVGIDVDPLSLKKHPTVLDTVKRLQRYVGNIEAWRLSQDAQDGFKADALLIRDLATKVYDKFKNLFPYKDEENFFAKFTEDCENFQESTKHLNESQLFALVAEPDSRKSILDQIYDSLDVEELKSFMKRED